MIKIEVENYCHPCIEFEADVEVPIAYYASGKIVEQTDTIVRCKHRRRCENIVNFIKEDRVNDSDR